MSKPAKYLPKMMDKSVIGLVLKISKVPVFFSSLKERMVIAEIKKTKETISGLLENYKFRDALFEVIDLSRKGNKYLQDKAPWILAKESNTQEN